MPRPCPTARCLHQPAPAMRMLWLLRAHLCHNVNSVRPRATVGYGNAWINGAANHIIYSAGKSAHPSSHCCLYVSVWPPQDSSTNMCTSMADFGYFSSATDCSNAYGDHGNQNMVCFSRGQWACVSSNAASLLLCGSHAAVVVSVVSTVGAYEPGIGT